MSTNDLLAADWRYVLDLLPADLEASAQAHVAMVRRRNVQCASDLLRLCLCYACCDLSLRQVAAQAALQTLAPGAIGDWPVQFEDQGQHYPMRLVALRKRQAAAEHEQLRLQRKARHKGHRLDPRALQAAPFVMVLTDLNGEQLLAAQALELYRLRWQIEIAFKRLKSLLHLDHRRAKGPALARTYLYAKLLGALLVEELAGSSLSFFPWGYRLFPTDRQSLAFAANLQSTTASGDQGNDPD